MGKRKKGFCILDLDGTLFQNFKKKDYKIIRKLFNDSKIVMKINDYLWNINDDDFITNIHILFKFRILIYSILSFTSYTENYYRYGVEYVREVSEELSDIKQTVNIIKKKYSVVILTHNPFLYDLRDEIPVIVAKCKPLYIFFISKKTNIKYIVGNNYMDDIQPAIKNGIQPIYVGSSKKIINGKAKEKIISFRDMQDATSFIISSIQ